jgi:type II secretory pathway component PulF
VSLSVRLRFNTRQRRDFYDDMRRFVSAQLAPAVIVEQMVAVYRKRPRLRWKVAMLKTVKARMDSGQSFGVAMSPYLPTEEATLLQSGEAGGMMAETLTSLTHLTTKRLEVNGALMKSIVPAALILLAAIVVMVVVMKMTLEQAVGMIPERVLADLTFAPLYFGLAQFLMSKGVLVALAAVAVVVVIARSLPSWKPGPMRRVVDQWIPPWSLYRRFQASFALVTTAAMLAASIQFGVAIETMRKTASPWLGAHLKRVNRGLGLGMGQVDSLLKSGLLPDDAADRLAIYSLIGESDEVMSRVAADSLEILINTVDRYGKTLNILVMVAVGGFILSTLFAFGEIGLAIDPKAMQNEALNATQ